MTKFSRTAKYKTLHDRIAMDSEAPIETSNAALAGYSRRLNTIEPAIISQDALNDLGQTLQHLDQVIESKPDFSTFTGPMGIVTGTYTRPRVQPAPRQAAPAVLQNPGTPYPEPQPAVQPQAEEVRAQAEPEPEPEPMPVPEYGEQPEPYAPKTAGGIRAEMEAMLSEAEADLPRPRPSRKDPVTDSLLLETMELKKELDEHTDEINRVENRIKQTHRIINGMLWTMIIALSAVLAAVVYFIVQGM